MKSNLENTSSVHGNESKEVRTKKQDVNLRKNGWLHFQIGLILSLAITYFTVEAAFPLLEAPEIVKTQPEKGDLTEDPFIMTVKPPAPEIKQTIVEPEPENSTRLTDIIKVIDDGEKQTTETKNVVVAQNKTSPDLNLGDIKYAEEEPEALNILAVEEVPLFPGCEGLASNKERIDCFSSKLNKLISKNFNSSLGAEFGLEGIQRINLVFKIDKQGKITDIKTRAPHPALAKEARRVINLVPQLKPGKQNNKEVEVLFAKPILFKVD